jgi:hypothetical protein
VWATATLAWSHPHAPVRSGAWDGAILDGELLRWEATWPGRRGDPHLRTEELPAPNFKTAPFDHSGTPPETRLA